MCVASGVSMTRTISSSISAGRTSNNRSPLAEQHRDLVDLHLIQHPGLERPLRRVRAPHLHVAVAGSSLRLRHRALDPVGHVRHQRIAPARGRAGRPVAGHEDGETAVITAPVVHELGGPPPREDRTGRVPFGLEPRDRPGLAVRVGPLVKPLAVVAAEEVVGVGDEPVE